MEGVERIAIVGMAGRFPGARNTRELWRNLRAGVESIGPLEDGELLANGVDEALLRQPGYVKAAAILPDMDRFDAGFFGFSPRDASILDPQHRHFLECSWEALESAGYPPETFPGSIGVYAGCGMNAYMMFNLVSNRGLMKDVGLFLLRHTGNDKDFLTTRLSYELNLRGPSVSVQTACSTSLVAIHLASQSLLNGECDLALAGGVTIEVPHGQGYLYEEGEILSHDGHCRSFAAGSTGTVFGSGVGVVVLRRLSEALSAGDHIHAVILGSAINNDGSAKVGYFAPSVDGQAAAIEEALAVAGVEASSIGYVEAHGTGTAVGDPIEIDALTQAFRSTAQGRQYCAVGSIKSNIGHLDTAAGVASVIKTTLSLEHREIPPSLHFERPNPLIDFAATPFFVNDKLRPWSANGQPRRATVNSLGVGGTNAHLVLEEAPSRQSEPSRRPSQLLLLSARSPAALEQATANLGEFLPSSPANLADVAHTLRVGRRAFSYRRAAVGRDAEDALQVLSGREPHRMVTAKAAEQEPSVAFLFPGGGAQHPNMGRDLYENEPVYRQAIDTCFAFMASRWKIELAPLVFPDEAAEKEARRELERPSLALPALFSTEYALCRLWESWGVKPAACIGHSMGEYMAALEAGVFSLEDGLSLVTVRGQLFEKLPSGGMLNVPLSEAELRPLLGERLSLAAINGPTLCVASGPDEDIEALQARLAAREIEAKRIHISVAAHSAMLEPILEEFRAYLGTLRFSPPRLPFISNVSGTWADPAAVQLPDYWVRHLRQTVRFADGSAELLRDPQRLLLEVGPSQSLSSLARLQPGAAPRVLASLPRAADRASALGAMHLSAGQLWTAGKVLDWSRLAEGETRLRVDLPTYPFEKQRYWIEAPRVNNLGPSVEAKPGSVKRADRRQWLEQPIWRKAPLPAQTLAAPTPWLVFAPLGETGEALLRGVRESPATAGQAVIRVEPGQGFAELAENRYSIDPERASDYVLLAEKLVGAGQMLRHILYGWSLQAGAQPLDPNNRVQREKYHFYWPLSLCQALAAQDLSEPISLAFLSPGFLKVRTEDRPGHPEAALLCGPARVLARELPEARTLVLDMEAGRGDFTSAFEAVVAELRAMSGEAVVALRGRERYIPDAVPLPLGEREEAAGNVFLITGGLGGIALRMAESLVRPGVKIALLSRTPVADRSQWEKLASSLPPGDPQGTKLRQLLALEAAGAELLPLAADVSDLASLEKAVATAEARFGPIDTVIHAAGILDDAPLALKEASAATRVLAPKVAGTLHLDAVFSHHAMPPRFVLFSSSSALLAPPGQVDYVAANAFLDAFAQVRPRTTAINWGMWSDVGMMALPTMPPETYVHPLLGARTEAGADRVVFERQYRVEDLWVLDEHRIGGGDQGGQAVLPGTAYAELAWAAMAALLGRPTPLEIQDLVFAVPLEVPAESGRAVRVSLERDGQGWQLSVSSSADGVRWTEHGRLRMEALSTPAGAIEIAELEARHARRSQVFGPETKTRQERHLRFGPRWRCLERIDFGVGSALARLSLPAPYREDLRQYPLHPALLDLATGFCLPVLDAYEGRDDFYVPMSYKSIRIFGPLTPQLVAHAVCHNAAASDVVAFDLTLADPQGRVLVSIAEFAMRRVDAAALLTPATTEPTFLELLRQGGILATEGQDVFQRILTRSQASRVIVAPVEMKRLAKALEASVARKALPGESAAAPVSGVAFVAPRNATEQAIAGVWQAMLGIARIGIHDDFFRLGGHSLLLTQSVPKIRKVLGAPLSAAALFAEPTVEAAARAVADLGKTAAAPEPEIAKVSRDKYRARTSTLGGS